MWPAWRAATASTAVCTSGGPGVWTSAAGPTLTSSPSTGTQGWRPRATSPTGATEPIAVPAEARTVSPDPAEDAKLEQEFLEQNRAAYEELRDRGLLPPQGANLVSQDINEYLLTGGPDAEDSPDVAETVAGARGVRLGGGWDELLRAELDKPYWTELLDFVTDEYELHEVYPSWEQVFAAFTLTPVDQVKVVIVGQDPYIGPGQAHGLAFSVSAGTTIPPSLHTIRQELAADLDISPADLPGHGDLTGWAEQGVLLLNTTLTVRQGQSGSHEGRGWETFTDAVIGAISAELDGVVFILWGGPAKKKATLIDRATPSRADHSCPSESMGDCEEPAAPGRGRSRPPTGSWPLPAGHQSTGHIWTRSHTTGDARGRGRSDTARGSVPLASGDVEAEPRGEQRCPATLSRVFFPASARHRGRASTSST